MEKKNNIINFTNKFRNYIPFAAIFILTAGLLFYFKEHKQNVGEFIETGKANLLSFYTQNLKPLLFKTDITNEDVFNFALYKNLPLDKEENKVLQVGYDEKSGSDYFEIKPAQLNENTKNYEKFVDYLKLTKEQKSQLDSILNMYKDELYTSVLYNDQNTIAVSSKVSLIRDAILADLMAFAQSISSMKYTEAVPAEYHYNTEEIRKAIKQINDSKEESLNNFVFFTPDSIFNTECEIDKKELRKKMVALDWNVKKIREELKDMKFDIKVNPIEHVNFNEALSKDIKLDSSYYKAFMPKNFALHGMKDLKDLEKLRINIDKLTSEIQKISVEVKTSEAGKIKYKMKNYFSPDSEMTFTFDLNLNGLDTLIQNSIPKFDEKDLKKWEEFGFKMDSLANSFQFDFDDSTITKFNSKEFKEEMKKVKEEIKKKNRKK